MCPPCPMSATQRVQVYASQALDCFKLFFFTHTRLRKPQVGFPAIPLQALDMLSLHQFIHHLPGLLLPSCIFPLLISWCLTSICLMHRWPKFSLDKRRNVSEGNFTKYWITYLQCQALKGTWEGNTWLCYSSQVTQEREVFKNPRIIMREFKKMYAGLLGDVSNQTIHCLIKNLKISS